MAYEIRFKDSVRIKKLNWQLESIFVVAYISYVKVAGVIPECTSLNDGKHIKSSYHYLNLAADFGIRELEQDKRFRVVKEIKKLLGSTYDVVLEADHIHIEFDLRKWEES
jgi:hypothetical protein